MSNLKLLVIRSNQIDQLVSFYSLLGLTFDYHKHGNSPFHYTALIGETVFEIYPLSKDQQAPDQYLRLGFFIDNFDESMQKLKDSSVLFVLEPTETEFGYMAIIVDPDGRKVELYK